MMDYKIDPPWSCAHCGRIEHVDRAEYVGAIFIGMDDIPYAVCQPCFELFRSLMGESQRRFYETVTLSLVRACGSA